MIQLRPDQEEMLAQVRRAGDEGVDLRTVGTATAISFALEGLASITPPPNQRVVITQQGAAYSRRGVYA
jgi:hypothetical protein